MVGIKGIAKKPITDATATPEDVISGQVFYNNDGKQIGTLSYSHPKTISIDVEAVIKLTGYIGNIYILMSSTNDKDFYISRTGSGIWSTYRYESITLQYEYIVGFSINGKYYNCMISRVMSGCETNYVVEAGQYKEYLILNYDGTIEFGEMCKGKSVTIYYY